MTRSKQTTFGPAFLSRSHLILLLALAVIGCTHTGRQTALDRYVVAPDPAYSYIC